MTGEIVLRRQFQRGERLGRVWVGRLAADDEHGRWVWISHGSQYFDVAAADGRSFRDVPFGQWSATPTVMRDLAWSSNVLMLHPHEGAYSLWFCYTPAGEFSG